MLRKVAKPSLVDTIQKIFADYYIVLANEIEHSRVNPTKESIKLAITRIEKEFERFWNIPEFVGSSNHEEYFKKIQSQLQSHGLHLDITPQYGVDTGNLYFETIDNISLRPIISRVLRKLKIGNEYTSYTESILGENLIKLPGFIEPIVEAAHPTEIVVFPNDLYKTLVNDYVMYKEYREVAEKGFVPGDLTANNLFCIQIKLHEKQWGKEKPSEKDQETLKKHFCLHGEQHVADFYLINLGKLVFNTDEMQVTSDLGKDAILEARVMIRQLLEKSLPYYVLDQIITFQREWLDNSQSEYAWAGHILFDGLTMKWALGIEKLSENDLYGLSCQFAYNNKNFSDMLTPEQLKEAQKV